MANSDRYGLARREQSLLSPFGNDWLMSPFGMMRRMADEMNQLLSSGVSGVSTMSNALTNMPNVDIRESAGSFIVEAEMPGLKPEQIDVQVHGDTLVIRAHSERHVDTQDQGYHLSERRHGSLYREVPLPGPVDQAHCSANYENGILEVHLPKSEQASGERIKVTSGTGRSSEGQMMESGLKGGESMPVSGDKSAAQDEASNVEG